MFDSCDRLPLADLISFQISR